MKLNSGKLFKQLRETSGMLSSTQLDITVKERNVVISDGKQIKFVPKRELPNFASRKLFVKSKGGSPRNLIQTNSIKIYD